MKHQTVSDGSLIARDSFLAHELKWHEEICDEGVHCILCSNPKSFEKSQEFYGGCMGEGRCTLDHINEHKSLYHSEKCDGKVHIYNVCSLASEANIIHVINRYCTPESKVKCYKFCYTYEKAVKEEEKKKKEKEGQVEVGGKKEDDEKEEGEIC
ncbi:hypothetical protein LSTR_LSTR000492 [Laodelphax striatellus]|uniref:Uncharacterized protein n=1 Tax=Laodelphax striatellus TaxID=195883 RepID=A0A482X1W5_LAOST|nr:hypothetical protein LSTR_LSTR000492 [Laodelphax striatellus]